MMSEVLQNLTPYMADSHQIWLKTFAGTSSAAVRYLLCGALVSAFILSLRTVQILINIWLTTLCYIFDISWVFSVVAVCSTGDVVQWSHHPHCNPHTFSTVGGNRNNPWSGPPVANRHRYKGFLSKMQLVPILVTFLKVNISVKNLQFQHCCWSLWYWMFRCPDIMNMFSFSLLVMRYVSFNKNGFALILFVWVVLMGRRLRKCHRTCHMVSSSLPTTDTRNEGTAEARRTKGFLGTRFYRGSVLRCSR